METLKGAHSRKGRYGQGDTYRSGWPFPTRREKEPLQQRCRGVGAEHRVTSEDAVDAHHPHFKARAVREGGHK